MTSLELAGDSHGHAESLGRIPSANARARRPSISTPRTLGQISPDVPAVVLMKDSSYFNCPACHPGLAVGDEVAHSNGYHAADVILAQPVEVSGEVRQDFTGELQRQRQL